MQQFVILSSADGDLDWFDFLAIVELGTHIIPYWIDIFPKNMNVSSFCEFVGNCITLNVNSVNKVKEL